MPPCSVKFIYTTSATPPNRYKGTSTDHFSDVTMRMQQLNQLHLSPAVQRSPSRPTARLNKLHQQQTHTALVKQARCARRNDE